MLYVVASLLSQLTPEKRARTAAQEESYLLFPKEFASSEPRIVMELSRWISAW
ncbi:hypothetical protein AARI_22420 [Glutamicibacter arilaitensis Re117]|uniref:Uncharacterized protein n=1 Tax=Glutamicibacter arilaitensis (strain DSM 16368 / CIP 108037 / IAM 15318 / JCM 13566 / NCIMB 14258 / Re117) TaxID=861360 RepID=A0ABM9PYS5_GLUAR|nr:hypothetical protein AARI_22420 [Glutamicibacter arilaitensis Re117]